MIENALNAKSVKYRMTVKSLISTGLIALAVGLPLIFHAILGAAGGQKWLPMYLPVLIGGCLLGAKWGAAVGALSPLASFAVTALFGEPMPAAIRLPCMAVELAVFGAVCGAFSKLIYDRPYLGVLAVIAASVSGRAVFVAVAAIFQSVSPLTAEAAWAQIVNGLSGLAVQAAVAAAVAAITAVVLKSRSRE